MKNLFKVLLYLLLPFVYPSVIYILQQYESVSYIAWDMSILMPLVFLLWLGYGLRIIGIKMKNEYIKNRLSKR